MTKPKPIFEFVDGVLLIDTKLVKMRLRWRPEPLAEELIPGGRKWRTCWPEFRLLRAPDETVQDRFARDIALPSDDRELVAAKNAAFAAFRATLPEGLDDISVTATSGDSGYRADYQ